MMEINQLIPSLVMAKNEGLNQQQSMQVALRSGLMAQAFGANQGMSILFAKREAERIGAVRAVTAKPDGQVVTKPDDPGPVVTGNEAVKVTQTGNPSVALQGALVRVQSDYETNRQVAHQDEIEAALKAAIEKLGKALGDCETPAEQILAMALALAGEDYVPDADDEEAVETKATPAGSTAVAKKTKSL